MSSETKGGDESTKTLTEKIEDALKDPGISMALTIAAHVDALADELRGWIGKVEYQAVNRDDSNERMIVGVDKRREALADELRDALDKLDEGLSKNHHALEKRVEKLEATFPFVRTPEPAAPADPLKAILTAELQGIIEAHCREAVAAERARWPNGAVDAKEWERIVEENDRCNRELGEKDREVAKLKAELAAAREVAREVVQEAKHATPADFVVQFATLPMTMIDKLRALAGEKEGGAA